MKDRLHDAETGIADKISEDDKETIEKALEEANEWLDDDHQEAEKEDIDLEARWAKPSGWSACRPIRASAVICANENPASFSWAGAKCGRQSRHV